MIFFDPYCIGIYTICICYGIVGSGVDLDPCFGVMWCPAPLALRSTRMTLTGTTT